MILCNWNSEWFLASKARAETPSCALIGGSWSRLSKLGFQHELLSVGVPGESGYHEAHRWHKFMPSMVGIIFYPTLHYRGLRVYPEYWHPESHEPLLHCRMMGDAITRAVQTESLPEASDHATQTGKKEDADRWRSLVAKQVAASLSLRQNLVNEGWTDQGSDGLVRFVYVDELEKIEGPPPKGAF